MKICFLADANSVHTKKWCNYFLSLGHELHVISLNKGDIEGATVYLFNKTDEKGGILSKLSYLTQFVKVKKLIRKIQPDILHAHYATSYGLLGVLSNYHPLIISVWGSDIYEFPRYGKIFAKLLSYNLKKADLLMSTSHAMSIEAAKYTDKHFVITPFGINTDVFKPIDTVDKSCFTIGTIKSLEQVYGLEYLIRAFAKFIENNPDSNACLRIGGRGSLEQELKELAVELNIQDKVKFLGFIAGEEKVAQEYSKFDIAIFPSLQESFGVAAIEAMACGVPVIVSDTGGLPEVTDNGQCGVVVPPTDVDALYNAIEKLYKDAELREKLSAKGREFVCKNYDSSSNFSNILSAYEQLIKHE
jgi:glycosyltransferase involved in cell wall biosynthesis